MVLWYMMYDDGDDSYYDNDNDGEDAIDDSDRDNGYYLRDVNLLIKGHSNRCRLMNAIYTHKVVKFGSAKFTWNIPGKRTQFSYTKEQNV